MAIYIGDLITEVRNDTENEDFSGTEGISTEDFLRYMNYGLFRLQGLLVQNNTTLFRRRVDLSVLPNQADYEISDHVYLKENLHGVHYSQDGNEANFREIREIADSYQNFNKGSSVNSYIRRGGKLILSPLPSVGSPNALLRVAYDRQLDRLDLRRGQVTDVTITAGVVDADTLELDTATDDPDRINGRTDKYLCVCDKNGNVKAYNIPYTLYDDGTGAFTHASHTLATGETIDVGDYVTVGKYTNTHEVVIDRPDLERYLQLYAVIKIFGRDSSNDMQDAKDEFRAVEQEIVESFRMIIKDEGNIQISDRDILILGD